MSLLRDDLHIGLLFRECLVRSLALANVHSPNIDFVVDTERGFLAPIANALSEFTETLGDGIGNAILGAAFILPWLVILLPVFYLVLYLWRRSKRKHQ